VRLHPLVQSCAKEKICHFHRGKLSRFSCGNPPCRMEPIHFRTAQPFHIVAACLREQRKASARTRGFVKRCCSTESPSVACACASTSQSSLSMPRETSVNKSAVSASPALLAVSIARRVLAPQFASALDNAATCFCPEAKSNG